MNQIIDGITPLTRDQVAAVNAGLATLATLTCDSCPASISLDVIAETTEERLTTLRAHAETRLGWLITTLSDHCLNCRLGSLATVALHTEYAMRVYGKLTPDQDEPAEMILNFVDGENTEERVKAWRTLRPDVEVTLITRTRATITTQWTPAPEQPAAS